MTTVSVVLAAYNGEKFLQAQLESILTCLRAGDELVLVDDSSTDRTDEIIAGVNWPDVVVLRNPVNRGVRATFEIGLRRARGEIVFLSDQDDLWVHGKRDAVVAEFETDPRCTVVVSDATVIDAGGREIEPSFMRTRGGFREDFFGNFVRNRFLGCAMALRREVVQVALPIPMLVPMHDMWLGLVGSLMGSVRYLDRPYLKYRRHGGNLSPATRRGWVRMIAWRFGLLLAMAQGLLRPGFRDAILRVRRDRSVSQT